MDNSISFNDPWDHRPKLRSNSQLITRVGKTSKNNTGTSTDAPQKVQKIESTNNKTVEKDNKIGDDVFQKILLLVDAYV